MRNWNNYEKIILTLAAVIAVLAIARGSVPGLIVGGLIALAVWGGALEE
jgi:hypothetical protein